MKTNLWRELWLNAMNPVFYDAEPFINTEIFVPEKYPAIQHLKNYSELQILILAWCILRAEEEEMADREVGISELQELFDNSLYSVNDFAVAIDTLVCQNWILARAPGKSLIVWANLEQLEEDKLYTQQAN